MSLGNIITPHTISHGIISAKFLFGPHKFHLLLNHYCFLPLSTSDKKTTDTSDIPAPKLWRSETQIINLSGSILSSIATSVQSKIASFSEDSLISSNRICLIKNNYMPIRDIEHIMFYLKIFCYLKSVWLWGNKDIDEQNNQPLPLSTSWKGFEGFWLMTEISSFNFVSGKVGTIFEHWPYWVMLFSSHIH